MPKQKRKPTGQPGRRRVQTGLSEQKTLALYREGRRMLAEQDFENISVAQVSKAAGISVGAFYVRFKDKTLFLDFVCLHTFGQARRRFDAVLGEIVAAKRPGELLADHLISEFSNGAFAGVTRAAIKLGFTDRLHRRALVRFRAHVAEQFVEASEPVTEGVKDAARRVAVQAALGVLVDAATNYDPDAPPNWQAIRPILVNILSQSKLRIRPKPKSGRNDNLEEKQPKPSKI